MSRQKKKVLMFGWEFPPQHNGGLGVACQGLCNALTELDTSVLFVLPRKMVTDTRENLTFLFGNSSVVVQTIDSLLLPYLGEMEYARRYGENMVSSYGKTLLAEVFRYADSARDLAKKNDFSIIHAHDWLTFPAGLAAKDVSGKPLVLHVHLTSIEQCGKNGANPDIYNIEKHAFEVADAIICVSAHTRDVVLGQYGTIDPRKVHVVHNGIDMDRFSDGPSGAIIDLKKNGNKIVLYVGRLTMHKGPDYFLRSAQKVLSYRDNVYFVFAGTGEMEGELMRLAVELGISEHVIFTGFNQSAELKQLYESADVFVMPSVAEPFGLTPLEALIHNTPVIISKQTGVSEVLQHALKVDFWDVDEMANMIGAVLEHDVLSKQLAQYGLEETRGLTWRRAGEKCLAVYNTLQS